MVSFPVVLTANAQGDCSSIPGRRKRNQGRQRVFSRSAVGNIGTIHRQGHRKNKKKMARNRMGGKEGHTATAAPNHRGCCPAPSDGMENGHTFPSNLPKQFTRRRGRRRGWWVGVAFFFATSRCKNIFNFFDLVFRFLLLLFRCKKKNTPSTACGLLLPVPLSCVVLVTKRSAFILFLPGSAPRGFCAERCRWCFPFFFVGSCHALLLRIATGTQ